MRLDQCVLYPKREVMACDKCILLNQEHSYAILFQNMCHGRIDARTFVINTLLQQCCVWLQYVQEWKILLQKVLCWTKGNTEIFVLIEDKSDDSDAYMETSPRNSLSLAVQWGLQKHHITGQQASKTAPIYRWWVLTRRSGLSDGYTVQHCTVLLDLISGSGFVSAIYLGN
jgi:hypothetical protein